MKIGFSKDLEWPGRDQAQSVGALVVGRPDTFLGSDRAPRFRHSKFKGLACIWQAMLCQ